MTDPSPWPLGADLRFDVYRAGDANSVRITHVPTGTVTECGESSAVWVNRERALAEMRQRLAATERTDEARWVLFDEAVRGFLLEKHLPFDTADEWTDTIVAIAREHLPPQAATT